MELLRFCSSQLCQRMKSNQNFFSRHNESLAHYIIIIYYTCLVIYVYVIIRLKQGKLPVKKIFKNLAGGQKNFNFYFFTNQEVLRLDSIDIYTICTILYVSMIISQNGSSPIFRWILVQGKSSLDFNIRQNTWIWFYLDFCVLLRPICNDEFAVGCFLWLCAISWPTS